MHRLKHGSFGPLGERKPKSDSRLYTGKTKREAIAEGRTYLTPTVSLGQAGSARGGKPTATKGPPLVGSLPRT